MSSKFKYTISPPYSRKWRSIPIHIQNKVKSEIKKLISEGHIEKLDKSTSDCFIAPIVITMKKDYSINLVLDAKPINRQCLKNKYRMPNIDELIVTEEKVGEQNFTKLNLRHAYSQFKLAADTARQCNLSIVVGNVTGTYRFLTGFYGLADKPAEYKKVMYITINHAINTFCFLDDIFIVPKVDKFEHEKLVKR